MPNNNAMFMVAVLAGCLTASAYGQPQQLGHVGTWSRDGWKFSASYFLEPRLAPGQQLSIAGQTDVMYTDSKDGRQVIFHRFFTDPEAKTYWGYDVEVEPTGKPSSAILRFRPFSLRADQLPKQYHAVAFLALPAPQFPAETYRSGQTIAIDMLKNPNTGQKVVDYIEVSYSPIGVPSMAAPRNFEVADVILHITAPSLRVNSAEILQAIVADQAIQRRLVWISVPGHGRFLLSLFPYAGYPFQKAGVVGGFDLSFSWNGAHYQWHSQSAITESSGNWNIYVLAAPVTTAEAPAHGFSYGAVNSVEEFLSKAQ